MHASTGEKREESHLGARIGRPLMLLLKLVQRLEAEMQLSGPIKFGKVGHEKVWVGQRLCQRRLAPSFFKQENR